MSQVRVGLHFGQKRQILLQQLHEKHVFEPPRDLIELLCLVLGRTVTGKLHAMCLRSSESHKWMLGRQPLKSDHMPGVQTGILNEQSIRVPSKLEPGRQERLASG